MARTLWNAADPRANALEGLVLRSNNLGKDRSICNRGGGNTSSKVKMKTRFDELVRVLAVKPSGADSLTLTEQQFALVLMEQFDKLAKLAECSDADVVELLAQGTFDSKRLRPSIEAPLHAFLPFTHIDHTHPDAVIALACTKDWQDHATKIWGKKWVAAPYIRPGFDLSKQIAAGVEGNAEAELVVMQSHGLVTWSNVSSKDCYENTIRVIEQAEAYVRAAMEGKDPLGEIVVTPLGPEYRGKVQLAVAPVLRGLVSSHGHRVLAFDDSPEILDWVGRERFKEVAGKGSPCPDHLPATQHWPCIVDWTPLDGVDKLKEALKAAVAAHVARYTAYFEANKAAGDVMLNPTPRVVLIQGLGMFTCGQDSSAASVSQEIYHRAIPVITGAEALGGFVPLSDAEAFKIEYWPLELYKATLKPAPKRSGGRIALVTGGGSGIGRATCRRLASEDAHVAIVDRDFAAAQAVADEINKKSKGHAIAIMADVGVEADMKAAFDKVVCEWGGVDYIVVNAGLIREGKLGSLLEGHMDLMYGVLLKGQAWTMQAGVAVLLAQGIGGAITVTTSKNAAVPTQGVDFYNALKAAQEHLARCQAVFLAPHKIRLNMVRPDAIIRDTKIWSEKDEATGKSRIEAKATASKVAATADEVAAIYIAKSPLRAEVLPEHVAAAHCFLLSNEASVITGSVLDVTAGAHLATSCA